MASEANLLYDALLDQGIEVLYDERKGITPGEKFKDSDLIGIPLRVVVSKKTVAEKKLEVVERVSGEVAHMNKEEFFALLKK